MKSNSNPWRWFFALAALEAGAAFVALVTVPHESGRLSASRLTVFAILGAFCIGSILAALHPPQRIQALAHPRYAVFFAIAALLLATGLFLLRYAAPERLLPYFERLAPLVSYLLILAAEGSIFSLAVRDGLHVAHLRREHLAWQAAGLAFLILLLGFAFVCITRIGVTPDTAYWGEPGVPVLAWQLGLALVVGVAIFAVRFSWRHGLGSAAALEPAFVIGIWLLAVVIWLSVPTGVLKNSFYAPINPPANQPFPNSDAGYYDSMAESLQIGYPYQGDIPTRPLYITLLAVLHLAVGENYALIIAGQTLLLALIPVLLYLLGRSLHSRAAGVIAALFAIFREWNSLLVSSQTRTSNTKMLLVDLPTMLLMLVACLFVVRWLQRRGRGDAMLAGGLVGLLFLLRSQTLLLLPIVIALALLAYGIRDRKWLLPLGLFIVGMLAAMAPWLIHNYLHSGQLTLDAPFEYQVIASQYKYTGNLDLQAVDLQGKGLFGLLMTFALKDPRFVAGFISSHFMATLIDSLLALPLVANYNGLFAPLNLYWINWPANIDLLNAAMLLPYMAVISVGMGSAWKRLRWIGLVPLAFALGYALANGIARFSGWRYDLPADWVAYFYFAIGAAQLFWAAALVLGADSDAAPSSHPPRQPRRLSWITASALCGLLAVVGALPWLAESIAPPRYASDALPSLITRLYSSPSVQRLSLGTQIESFVAGPQATLQIGRVLYPRYFSRGNGLASAHPWPAYAPRDFPRMGFLLLNQSRHDALMPLRDSSANFVQGGDAIVLGCVRQDYIEVRLILFPATDSAYLSAPLTQGCN